MENKNNTHLKQIFDRIDEIGESEDRDGYRFKATKTAIRGAKKMVEELAKNAIVSPEVISDNSGGIEIQCYNGSKFLLINIKSTSKKNNFLYWQDRNYEYGGGDLTEDYLRQRIEWFVG